MVKLILINVLLFVLCIILFVLMAAGINFAMGTAPHGVETAMAYIAVALIHLFINYALLKKRELGSLKNKIISTVIIVGVYILYLFIYT